MATCSRGCVSVRHFCQKLRRRKTLDDNMMSTPLKRCLSVLDLTLLGVGAMVGSGIYVLTGTLAKDLVGPAVIISYLFAGFASLLAALCYAEFGARVPKTGCAYVFTYISVGEIWAFLIGWDLILEALIGGAAVARAWSGYLDSIFNHTIQNFTETHVLRWNVPYLATYPDILAAAILLVASIVLACGVQTSSYLNHIFATISMCVITFVLVVGFVLAEPANWSQKEGGFAPFGWSGILAGTATCFYAFVGFDIIASSSEEAKNPQRDVPIAIAISLGIAALAYVLVSTVLTLMVPWRSLDTSSALADAFFRRGLSWAGYIVAIGSICGMNSVLLSSLFSLPRIVYAMAEDGLFFSVFARVNSVTKVPVFSILMFGVLMALLALVFDLEALVQFFSIGTLLAYTFVAASVIVLRFQPDSLPTLPGPNTEASSESHTITQHGDEGQGESISDKLQLVERQKKRPCPRVGQLRAFWEPYLDRFLGDFEPGSVVTCCVPILSLSAFSFCAVLEFGHRQMKMPVWGVAILLVVFSLAYVISVALIWCHEPQSNNKTFQVPLVPLTPAVSILVNIFLVMQLSYLTWLRFSIWLIIGMLVYFGYGIWNSKAGKRELQASELAADRQVLPGNSQEEMEQRVQPEGQPEVNQAGDTKTSAETCAGVE